MSLHYFAVCNLLHFVIQLLLCLLAVVEPVHNSLVSEELDMKRGEPDCYSVYG